MKYKEKERETQEVGNAVLDCVLTEGLLQIGGTGSDWIRVGHMTPEDNQSSLRFDIRQLKRRGSLFLLCWTF